MLRAKKHLPSSVQNMCLPIVPLTKLCLDEHNKNKIFTKE